jgi:hypothetical protein
MRDSKLVTALMRLDAWELRHLSDFVHSPFFNKHQRLSALFDWVITQAPDYPAEALQRDRVYALLFVEEPYLEQKWKDLLSQGMKLLRQFMAYYRIRQQPFSVGMAALDELRERGWEAEFIKCHQQLEETVSKRQEKLQERYLKRLQLQEAWISFQTSTVGRTVEDSIQVASDLLDHHFILSKLKYGVEMANRQNVVAQKFDTGLLSAVLAHLAAHPTAMSAHPVIEIYLLIYRCLIEEDSASTFERLRLAIQTHVPDLPLPETREIYAYAINFCIRQVNKGGGPYLDILLALYQSALDDGALFSDGWLFQWDYKNIVSAGLKARNFSWCEQFIETYKNKLEPSTRDNAYTYNLASLCFEQGDLRRALRLLQHVEFSDVFYQLGAKVILLKSFYELEDYEALLSTCDAFKIYLKRNKTLSQSHYTVNFNLVGFTRKLASLRQKVALLPAPALRIKLAALQADIQTAAAVAQLSWLQAQIALLAQQLA